MLTGAYDHDEAHPRRVQRAIDRPLARLVRPDIDDLVERRITSIDGRDILDARRDDRGADELPRTERPGIRRGRTADLRMNPWSPSRSNAAIRSLSSRDRTMGPRVRGPHAACERGAIRRRMVRATKLNPPPASRGGRSATPSSGCSADGAHVPDPRVAEQHVVDPTAATLNGPGDEIMMSPRGSAAEHVDPVSRCARHGGRARSPVERRLRVFGGRRATASFACCTHRTRSRSKSSRWRSCTGLPPTPELAAQRRCGHRRCATLLAVGSST